MDPLEANTVLICNDVLICITKCMYCLEIKKKKKSKSTLKNIYHAPGLEGEKNELKKKQPIWCFSICLVWKLITSKNEGTSELEEQKAKAKKTHKTIYIMLKISLQVKSFLLFLNQA